MPVAQFAQTLETLARHGPDAALALDGLDQDTSGFRPDGLFDCLNICKRHLVEPFNGRPEPLDIFLLTARGDGCQCAAVKSTGKRDQAKLLGMAGRCLVLARHLDGTFQRLAA